MTVPLRSLPLIAAVVPFVGVTLSYWIATSHDLVPSCVPYIDGCTSISATGRYQPASFLFKAIQMPLGVLLGIIWVLSVGWLRSMGHTGRNSQRLIVISGLIGGIALIIYVSFLGTSGPFYEFMRRFGIYFYFLGTSVAQLTLALGVARIDPKTVRFEGLTQSPALIALAVLPFLLGILNLVLKPFLDDPDPMENRIEWIAALIMQVYFVYLWLAWRATGFRVAIGSDVR